MRKVIPSGCIGICNLYEGTCRGCGRRIEEIRDWFDKTDEEKLNIHKRIYKDTTKSNLIRMSSKSILDNNYDSGYDELDL